VRQCKPTQARLFPLVAGSRQLAHGGPYVLWLVRRNDKLVFLHVRLLVVVHSANDATSDCKDDERDDNGQGHYRADAGAGAAGIRVRGHVGRLRAVRGAYGSSRQNA
jgi:hypothetical protein